MKHLGLIGAVFPLVLLAIGLIGWVLTVRNDVTDAVKQITAVQEEIAAINERMENERTIRTDLHTDQSRDLVTITNALSDRLSGLGPTSYWPTIRWRPLWGITSDSGTPCGSWERSGSCRPVSAGIMAGTATDDAEDKQPTQYWTGPGGLHLGSKPGMEPCISGDMRPGICRRNLLCRSGDRTGRLMRFLALPVLAAMITVIGSVMMLGWVYEGPRRFLARLKRRCVG